MKCECGRELLTQQKSGKERNMSLICVVVVVSGVFHWQEQRWQVVAHQESVLSVAGGPSPSLQNTRESFWQSCITFHFHTVVHFPIFINAALGGKW